MSRNVYHEINLHLVWRTKLDAPVLIDHIENRCHHCLVHRATRAPGVFVHAVGGMPDHVHMAVSLPPTLLISEWIGDMKGSSSHHINHEICNSKVLDWQTGYGVVSFGTRDLDWVVRYVREQKERHARGQISDRLERIDRIEDPPKNPETAEGGHPHNEPGPEGSDPKAR